MKVPKEKNTRFKNFEKIPNFFTTLDLQLQKSYLTQYLWEYELLSFHTSSTSRNIISKIIGLYTQKSMIKFFKFFFWMPQLWKVLICFKKSKFEIIKMFIIKYSFILSKFTKYGSKRLDVQILFFRLEKMKLGQDMWNPSTKKL